jgi:hypothetical protein
MVAEEAIRRPAAAYRLGGSRRVTCSVRNVRKRRRASKEIPLCEIDAIPAEEPQRLGVAHEFSDRTLAETAGHADHRLHEVLVYGVARQVTDEAAIDLQVIDGQMLEMREGREANTEVVEREAAAQRFQRPRELLGFIDARVSVTSRMRLAGSTPVAVSFS